MRRFLAALILAGCATVVPPKSTTVTSVQMWRTTDTLLHVDTAFEGVSRVWIREAANNIGRLTHDRARVHVVFDLDFRNLTHGDSYVIAVLSTDRVVETLDRVVKGSGRLLAATQPMKDGSTTVFVILDRIDPDMFENVMTHEFGHVIGLPDLDTLGSIMSGRSVIGEPPVADWTPADIAVCREYHFCD